MSDWISLNEIQSGVEDRFGFVRRWEIPEYSDGSNPGPNNAYVYGVKTALTPADTDKWIVVNLATGAITYSATDPSNPLPANEEWYEIAYTNGDIHIAVR